ncbi:hypothetical protein [Paenibacillus rigui]|uniref:Uncharacterized protein n=1 Tax=Paenibacillus rigui TaxID=554312 RepID=A0A229UHN3_9BACL|nr:hypothetical protein [Paenibacillus rigui]OXM82805.1 hypothetical protein CF651_29520 [Paenibacillus rigui]
MDKRTKRLSHGQTYGLAYMTGGLLLLLAMTLLWSRPPVTGIAEKQPQPETDEWKIGYIVGEGAPNGQLPNGQQLGELLAQRSDLLLVAGSASLAGSAGEPAPRSFFPVWGPVTVTGEDSATAEANAAARFPHIPEEQLPGYGRTAYFVDYGEARFWFLDAARLAQEPSVQLDWLKRSAAKAPRLHRIALLHEEPPQPEVWAGLAASGVDLVLIDARLYAPEAAVTGRPGAGYRLSAHSGWAEWTVSSGGGSAVPPPLLTVEGRGSRLTAAAPGTAGREADRLEVDAAALRQAAAGAEQAPVAIGAAWRYRAGGPAVRAVIPPGMDPAGERPLQERVQLPPEDWRSPAYDDAGWSAASAPFGRTRDTLRARLLQTQLPVQNASPAVYFRRSFVLEDDPSAWNDWVLQVAFEDGFVAYLNGNEIARDSMRDGWVDGRSLASPHENKGFESFSLKGHEDLFVRGRNVLAVEVHTSHPAAPEMWFDASLTARK